MNRLEAIRAAVEAHFAVWEEINPPPDRTRDSAYANALANQLDAEHPAMCHLRDLLPLLEAAVICGDDIDYSDEIMAYAVWNLNTEVHKLLEEAS